MPRPSLPAEPIAIILCDDIRREQNGKDMLIGVYGGGIIPSIFPAALNLALWIQLRAIKVGPQSMRIRLQMEKGQPMAELSFEFSFARIGETSAASVPGIGVMIREPGTLLIQAQRPDEKWITIHQTEITAPGPTFS